jgi:hypothetical protein
MEYFKNPSWNNSEVLPKIFNIIQANSELPERIQNYTPAVFSRKLLDRPTFGEMGKNF